MESIKIFAILLVMDIIWCRMTLATANRAPAAAAAWATSLYVLTTWATFSVLSDLWLMIPAAAGGFVGTYIGVKWEGLWTSNKS